MTETALTPPDWYPDPMGRAQLRYWDGTAWTDHVSTNGQTSIDPVQGGGIGGIGGFEVGRATTADDVQRQVQQRAGVAPSAAGGGTLFTEPVLVVNQKAKLIEVTNEYQVFDQNGTQIGAVRQVGQTAAKKVLRMVSNLDQFMTHTLHICDMGGNVVLQVTRPRKVLKSTVIITNAAGAEVGRVVQENAIGKIRFRLEAGGLKLGSINAENWRAWNFNIRDAAENEIARITKTWEGMGRAMFTTADNYVLQIHQQIDEPLRSLVVASALSVDTALKQDSGGFS